jgi:nicotinamide phosphoribosyltransferase
MKKHFGDYTDLELKSMSPEDLVAIIKNVQDEDNFIIMTDSYKMTHHLLSPEKIEEVYSYMEPRGGEMPYTVFFGLQYYIKRFLAGVRVTPDKIEAARKKAIAHFGFDCFNDKMWYHIWQNHGGRLPLEIKAVPEGTPVSVKNILMSIRNTDKKCGPLSNITETLLMKIWATNTVAAYARLIKELMVKYHEMSSDAPAWLIDFMHHDFGYRGANSEESARILGAAALTSFKGTDTMGALVMLDKYYGEPMAGFSVIASEHSVMCSYGGKDEEKEAYRTIINRVKKEAAEFNPPSGVIILSLVSDTFNIYRVCHDILPSLKSEFIDWKNKHGIPIKIVVRPDSGDPESVLFGDKNVSKDDEIVKRMVGVGEGGYGYPLFEALSMIEKGIFRILMDQFGNSFNSKGFKTLNPQIGVLQGDGVSLKSIKSLYLRMMMENIDSMSLVFGSGGKLLQAHDRDEQKYAIKATHVIVDGKGVNVEKNPITDPGKRSKKGYLKLVNIMSTLTNSPDGYKTIQSGDPGFESATDILQTVFLNGELIKEFTFSEVRKNAEVTIPETANA